MKFSVGDLVECNAFLWMPHLGSPPKYGIEVHKGDVGIIISMSVTWKCTVMIHGILGDFHENNIRSLM